MLIEERACCYLVLEPFEPPPAAHNERVVRSDDGDHVNALGLELVVLLQVGWEMVGVAGRLFYRVAFSSLS